jgi:hypothetical protein
LSAGFVFLKLCTGSWGPIRSIVIASRIPFTYQYRHA